MLLSFLGPDVLTRLYIDTMDVATQQNIKAHWQVAIRKQLGIIVKQRRVALEQKTASPSQDLLSHLLVSSDENGGFLSETEIVDNILMLLFAGHDTSSVVITLLMKNLGQFPQVYEKVLREFTVQGTMECVDERVKIGLGVQRDDR
ncbi:hypothetical protein RJ639_026415 [Escallonia herrerae]|uniref:Cytochrome P450 n=1 Tax=Escallonia herrerae TaxID=1293975 RepID=A0AA88UWA4_9ASTE|nr:hypothetical protein RJ639_026415 [Escallonia herrerae]